MQLFKVFLFGFFLTLSLFFTGCQGNNSDPVDSNSSIITPPPIDINATTDIKNLSIINGNKLTITGSGTSKDIYIMAFNSSGSTNTAGNVTFQYPSAFISGTKFYGLIDPGTATVVDGRVHFVYTAPDDIRDINGSSATFLFYDTNNSDVNVSLVVDFNLTGDYVSTDPILKTLVLSDDNITAYENSQSIDLTLQAYSDQSTTNISPTLKVKYPDTIINNGIDIGTLPATLEVIDGVVAFTYTAPANLADTLAKMSAKGITNPIKINIFDSNTSTNVDLNLNIIPSSDPKYQNYKLSVYPDSNITITTASQSAVVEALVIDTANGNKPVSGEDILVTFFDATKGTLSSFSGTTDVNGHIALNYTAPNDITGLGDLNITMKLSADVSKTDFTTVKFDTTVVTNPKYINYKLSVYPDNNITVTSPDQNLDIYINLETNSSQPAIGENILLNFFNRSKGSMNTFSSTTDATGTATFKYTAPSLLTDLNNTVLTFKLENDASKEINATIIVDTNASEKDYSNYILSAVDVNRTISHSSQVETFDLYLKNNNTNGPAEGDTITVDFFDGASGTMDKFSATTDATGHAQFTYTAPTDISDLNNSQITFRIKNTTQTVVSTLSVNANVAELPNLHMESSKITITKNAELLNIKVLAYYNDGVAFDKGSIIVKYPLEVVDGNVSAGTFAQSEVNIVNGEAIFNFTGPDPVKSIAPLNELNFVFAYKDDNDKNTTLTLKYSPEIPALVFDNDAITVTTNGEIVNIGVNVYDSSNAPYPDGVIKIKYPQSVLSGKNVGSFNESNVSVVNGKANFIYTAPSPLEGNESIIFTFYHDSQPALSEKDLNITIIPDPNQIVPTNYSLKSINETTINLNTSSQMTFYVYDEESKSNLPDSNLTSMKVTVLNPALGTLIDSNGTTGSTISSTNKNPVQLSIKSNTISGIIPIEVYTEFKDANNIDTNLTTVFNVVVLSGPPTAMSLSYAGTDQNSSTAKFIENWVLTVTDKYNNLVNSNPAISTGLITGYTQSSAATGNAGNYLYFGTSAGGTLQNISPNDKFVAPALVFGNVDLTNDKLVLFGTGYVFDASGKWDINAIDSNTTLSLVDDFNGTNTSGLGYAVGHNFRNETCNGNSVVANVYAKDGNNILGSNGSMILQVEYDYYLVGKSVMLWTNLVGEHNNTTVKVGQAQKITLRGTGLVGESYAFAKGYTGVVRLDVNIKDTPRFYQNANFSYSVEIVSDGEINASVTDTSMSGKTILDCTYSGVGYVDVTFHTPAGDKGTVSLKNVLVSQEF